MGKGNTDKFLAEGIHFWDGGDIERAAEFFKKALHEDPQNSEANCRLALYYLRSKNFEESLKYVDQAIKTGTEKEETVFLKAECLIQLKNPKKAIECLEASLKKGIKSERILKTLGRSYYELSLHLQSSQNFEEAMAIAQKGLEKYHSFSPLYKLLGKIYFEEGDNKSAAEHLNTYIEEVTGDPEAYVLLGDIYTVLQDVEKSLNNYGKAITIAPEALLP
ncbi:MAG: tetratricopeptide repeat protein, partial [Candidatus Eremiobacterota bacterium]